MAISIPAEVQPLIWLLAGQDYPDGDPDALRRHAQALMNSMVDIAGQISQTDRNALAVHANAQSMSADDFGSFINTYVKDHPELTSGSGVLPGMFKQAESAAQTALDQANETEFTQLTVIFMCILVLTQIAIAIAQAIFTDGASLLEVPGFMAMGRTAVLRAIGRFLQMVLTMMIPDLLSQGVMFAQGHGSWDWNKTWAALENAGLAGSFAMVLGPALEKYLPFMRVGAGATPMQRVYQLATHFIEGGTVNVYAQDAYALGSWAFGHQPLALPSFQQQVQTFLQGGTLATAFHLPGLVNSNGTRLTFTADNNNYHAYLSDAAVQSLRDTGFLPSGYKATVYNENGLRAGTGQFDNATFTMRGQQTELAGYTASYGPAELRFQIQSQSAGPTSGPGDTTLSPSGDTTVPPAVPVGPDLTVPPDQTAAVQPDQTVTVPPDQTAAVQPDLGTVRPASEGGPVQADQNVVQQPTDQGQSGQPPVSGPGPDTTGNGQGPPPVPDPTGTGPQGPQSALVSRVVPAPSPLVLTFPDGTRQVYPAQSLVHVTADGLVYKVVDRLGNVYQTSVPGAPLDLTGAVQHGRGVGAIGERYIDATGQEVATKLAGGRLNITNEAAYNAAFQDLWKPGDPTVRQSGGPTAQPSPADPYAQPPSADPTAPQDPAAPQGPADQSAPQGPADPSAPDPNAQQAPDDQSGEATQTTHSLHSAEHLATHSEVAPADMGITGDLANSKAVGSFHLRVPWILDQLRNLHLQRPGDLRADPQNPGELTGRQQIAFVKPMEDRPLPLPSWFAKELGKVVGQFRSEASLDSSAESIAGAAAHARQTLHDLPDYQQIDVMLRAYADHRLLAAIHDTSAYASLTEPEKALVDSNVPQSPDPRWLASRHLADPGLPDQTMLRPRQVLLTSETKSSEGALEIRVRETPSGAKYLTFDNTLESKFSTDSPAFIYRLKAWTNNLNNVIPWLHDGPFGQHGFSQFGAAGYNGDAMRISQDVNEHGMLGIKIPFSGDGPFIAREHWAQMPMTPDPKVGIRPDIGQLEYKVVSNPFLFISWNPDFPTLHLPPPLSEAYGALSWVFQGTVPIGPNLVVDITTTMDPVTGHIDDTTAVLQPCLWVSDFGLRDLIAQRLIPVAGQDLPLPPHGAWEGIFNSNWGGNLTLFPVKLNKLNWVPFTDQLNKIDWINLPDTPQQPFWNMAGRAGFFWPDMGHGRSLEVRQINRLLGTDYWTTVDRGSGGAGNPGGSSPGGPTPPDATTFLNDTYSKLYGDPATWQAKQPTATPPPDTSMATAGGSEQSAIRQALSPPPADPQGVGSGTGQPVASSQSPIGEALSPSPPPSGPVHGGAPDMTVNLTAGSPQASHPTADVSATSAGPLTPQQRLQAEVTELNQDIAFTKGRLQAAEVAWALGPGTGADHVSQLRMELNMLTKTRSDALHQIRDLRRAARQSARSGVGTS